MEKEYTCRYCKYWVQSKVISRTQDINELSSKKKKKTSLSYIKRECKFRKKPIEVTTPACKFFNPEKFWCERENCWMGIIVCLARRRNPHNLSAWDKCKKCRQFDNEIRKVVIDYWVNGKKVKNPEKEDTIDKKLRREIKRHIKKKRKELRETPSGKRKIKRRKKNETEVKRTIKRRKNVRKKHKKIHKKKS